jgi:hypothetical protein
MVPRSSTCEPQRRRHRALLPRRAASTALLLLLWSQFSQLFGPPPIPGKACCLRWTKAGRPPKAGCPTLSPVLPPPPSPPHQAGC